MSARSHTLAESTIRPLDRRWRCGLIKRDGDGADVGSVATIGTTCATCGVPTDGAYRCGPCTTAAELAEREKEHFSLAPPSSSSGGVRHSALMFPLGSLVTGIARATDNGLLPRWLPRTLLVLIGGWIVFLFIWGFAH